MKQLVFVYGSLKSGHWNNDILGTSTLVSKAVTLGKYVLTNCGFPYLIPEHALRVDERHPTAPVVGEVYEVTCDKIMASLDALEGVPHHYEHYHTIVKDVSGNEYEVVAYTPVDIGWAVSYPLCGKTNMNGVEAYEW